MADGAKRSEWLPLLAQSLAAQSKSVELLKEIVAESSDDISLQVQIAIKRALAFSMRKEWGNAEDELKKAERLQPRNEKVSLAYARFYLGQKYYPRAFARIEQALEIKPDSVESLLFKGNLLLQLSQVKNAKAVFEGILKSSPGLFQAKIGLAVSLVALGDIKEAETLLSQLLVRYKNIPIVHSLMARVYFAKGDFRKAGDSLQQVFRLQADHIPSLALASYVFLELDNINQALTSQERVISRIGLTARSLKFRAVLHLEEGSADKVILHRYKFRIVNDRDSHILLGLAYIQKKDFKSAYSQLSSALSLSSKLSRTGRDQGDKQDKLSHVKEQRAPGKPNGQYVTEKTVLEKHLNILIANAAKRLGDSSAVNTEAQVLLGMVRLIQGDRKAAEEVFRAVIKDKPGEVSASLNLAMLAILDKDYEGAEKSIRSILSHNPDEYRAHMAMVVLNDVKGSRKEAVKWLVRAWKKKPDSLRSGLSLLRYYLSNKELKKAREVGDEILSRYSANLGVMKSIGRLYLTSGEVDSAASVFEKIAKLDRKSGIGYLWLAVSRIKERDLKGANRYFDLALNAEEKKFPVLVAKARANIGFGNYRVADNIVKGIQQTYPEVYIGHQLRGDILMRQKQFSDAIPHYRKAFELRKGPAQLVLLSQAIFYSGDKAQAFKNLNEWLVVYPQHYRVRLALGGLYQNEGRSAEALEQYLELDRRKQAAVAVLNNIVWLLAEQKDKRVKSYADRLSALKINAPGIMDTLGWAYLQIGDTKTSLRYLKQAAQKAPGVAEIQYHFAAALYANGQKSSALKVLRPIIKAKKDFQGRKAAEALYARLR
jgi:putative PEP-CTERM system TPR-repeat lipoprotein